MTDINFGFEVDFLPVDSGSKSGDAIASRYGQLKMNPSTQRVIVVDGGTLESGQKLIEHVTSFYGTETVDLMISTHPDNDHCSGLREVINNLKVKELWVHTPWHYATEYLELFKDGRMTENSLREKLREGLDFAHELETTAKEKKIIIREPFAGCSYDNDKLLVLGPSESYYHELAPQFRNAPELKEEGGVIAKSFSAVMEVVKTVMETLQIETLDESGVTHAENNSSVITLMQLGPQKLLLTSDAGIPALQQAIKFAIQRGISLKDLNFVQVPHHGSRRNVSPSVLNEIKGQYACISVSKDATEKHPAKKVVNAFIRRGAVVFSTKGQSLRYALNAPARGNWGDATPLPFSNQVEE